MPNMRLVGDVRIAPAWERESVTLCYVTVGSLLVVCSRAMTYNYIWVRAAMINIGWEGS